MQPYEVCGSQSSHAGSSPAGVAFTDYDTQRRRGAAEAVDYRGLLEYEMLSMETELGNPTRCVFPIINS